MPSPERDLLARGQRNTLLTLFAGYTGYYVCRSNLSVSIPLILQEYEGTGITEEELGAMASLGVLLYAIGKIGNGLLADFAGGRAMFLFGMFASVGCTIAFGLASGLAVMTVAWAANRFVQSMGWVALVKTASRWFPVHRHATVMGVLSMSYLLGDAFARGYLGAFIDGGVGWRGVFLISAATLLAIAVVALFTLKTSPASIGADEPPANPRNVFGSAGDAERPTGLRELLRPLLASRIFWLVCAMNFGLTLTRETFNLWTPRFLQVVGGVSVGEAAFSSLLFPLVGGVAAFVAGRLSDFAGGRHGRVVFPSLLLLIVTLATLATVPLQGHAALSLTLVCAVSFFLIVPYSFLSGVMALDLGGKRGASTAAGLVDSAGYTGAIASGWGVGAIVESNGWAAAFGVLTGVCAVTAVIALVYWVQHEKAHREHGQA